MTKYITITTAGRTVDYTIDTCTAIDLLSIWTGRGEASRQHALLVSYTGETGELIRSVVFGWQMPEDAADLLDMLGDPNAWESDCDVLDTVRPSPRCIRVYTSSWRIGSGWINQNDPLDDWDLDGSQATMDKLPGEATDWMTSALLGEQPEDCDLVDAADSGLVDVQITMELAEKVGDHEYITLDTRSAWRSDLAKAYIAKYGDSCTIAALAEKIRSLDTWDESLCAALCTAAGMTAEWDAADGDTYESVVLAAAEKLGVEIL